MSSGFSGRVLITGASSGVGRAAVDAFAGEECDLALLARSVAGLEAAAESARRAGSRALVLPADITDRAAVDAAMATAERELGGLDVVVMCAAALSYGPFTELPADDFDRTVAVTFIGAVNCVRAALPVLERSGGVVVCIGSTTSTSPLPTVSAYTAAKHALRGFLRTLRVELQAQGGSVRIIQVDPGLVNTPLWEHSTGATGELPRRPPTAYSPSAVAAELRASAEHPRAEETTLGLQASLEQILLSSAGAIPDLARRAIFHFLTSGARQAPRPGALWQPMGGGVADGAVRIARASLTAPLRRLLIR
jgi:NAD(P)-dependent dehydrogenase (short-subunit alcohol dehydrogenase family)